MATEKIDKAAVGLVGIMGQDVSTEGAVPQSQPLTDKQVKNDAGGYVWKLDDMARLRRFLIIGSEGGTYYAEEQRLTLESARAIKALIDAGRGPEVVAEIVRVSTEGRAPKQTAGIFALAVATRLGDQKTKWAAYAAVGQVARTASTLFDFIAFSKAVNKEVAEVEGRKVDNASWGRGMRHAIANWYLDKGPMALAYQVTKYGMRCGFSHRDVLRLCHPKAGFIRTAAQRQATKAIGGKLEGLPSQVAAAADEDEDWDMVDAPSPALIPASNSSTGGAAAASAPDAIEQRVADMQRVFEFIVKEEAAPAGDDAGKLEVYLSDAHRLKKAKADLPAPPQPEESDEGKTLGTREAMESELAKEEDEAKAERKRKAEERAGGAGRGKKEKRQKMKVEDVTLTQACALITKHRFSREHVGDTRLLKEQAVWQTLVGVGMPFTALTRNLGRLSALGMFDPDTCEDAPANLEAVCARFRDEATLKAARAHPITLLNALRVYSKGHGDKGSLKWEAQPKVKEALEAGFYAAFRNVQPTGKRFLLGVDVSGSMDWECAGMQSLRCRDAATAIAMCLKRTEPSVHTMAFSDTFLDLKLEATDTLEQALQKADDLPFASTDCSLPMTYATSRGLKVDVFVVLTDNDTWSGQEHASEAVKRYRRASGIADAKLLVLAFAGNAASIADPDDPNMMDVAGLDSGVPEVMRQFVLGEI